MAISIFDLFKIGIGPSSSHTVGPMIAAKRFVENLHAHNKLTQVTRIKAEMFGSLGTTGNGHGTPKAVLLGLLGETPESVDINTITQRIADINQSQTLALLNQHSITFIDTEDLILHRQEVLPFHANGMCFSAFSAADTLIEKNIFYSVGGGFILNEKQAKDGPIINDSHTLAYPFHTAKELLAHCNTNALSIADIMRENEIAWRSRDDIAQQIGILWSTMQDCVTRGCNSTGLLPGGLKVERRASKLFKQLKQLQTQSKPDSDPLVILDWITLYALAVNEENAAGGRIVTAPTNGAAGIIPAVLHYYQRFISGASTRGIEDFLLTAGAIGILYKENASISGAEVGCQGEVGSACSMAAGALAAVLGGTPEQVENAAEIAMEHHLGLTCDPIGGLVQIPCIERNAVASVSAIHAARIALQSDGSHIVSLDKVIQTMKETGRDMMDKYKETARGGLATNVIEVPVNIIEC